MNNDSTGGTSAAVRIADALAREFLPLPAGTRLPSQRDLVTRYQASATTVAQALVILAHSGLVESRPGAGSFRAQHFPHERVGNYDWQETALNFSESESGIGVPRRLMGADLAGAMRDHGPDVVDLSSGYLHPNLQPLRLLTTAMSRVAKRRDVWERPAIGGVPALRDWFATEIGGGLGRGDVLIAPGGQAALATTVRALTQPGDPIIVESPTYPGIIAAAQAAALHPVPVPLDGDGMVPDALDEALSRTRARVVIVQPLHQNPTATTMTPDRQRQIRDIARQHSAFVIEDDFARMLTHADAPDQPAPLITEDPNGTVILLRSLTKCTSPNIRVAAIAARGAANQRIRAALMVDTLVVPAVLQYAVLELVRSPGWRGAQRDLRVHLRDRCQTAAGALARGLGSSALGVRPHGGYHLWVRLPPGMDSVTIAGRALARNVSVTAGAHYYLPGQENQPHLRISYVATPGIADVEEAAHRLADVISNTDV
ncbi:PLP-dependent aminotransferase family protein [Leifsonia sp. NPDC056824]|uniref:aminotransferase-like domain-containing protein n=1 Tax=Leifsonia sp. NPDC056824 TaxID=3345953 RepID=UPI003685BF82